MPVRSGGAAPNTAATGGGKPSRGVSMRAPTTSVPRGSCSGGGDDNEMTSRVTADGGALTAATAGGSGNGNKPAAELASGNVRGEASVMLLGNGSGGPGSAHERVDLTHRLATVLAGLAPGRKSKGEKRGGGGGGGMDGRVRHAPDGAQLTRQAITCINAFSRQAHDCTRHCSRDPHAVACCHARAPKTQGQQQQQKQHRLHWQQQQQQQGEEEAQVQRHATPPWVSSNHLSARAMVPAFSPSLAMTSPSVGLGARVHVSAGGWFTGSMISAHALGERERRVREVLVALAEATAVHDKVRGARGLLRCFLSSHPRNDLLTLIPSARQCTHPVRFVRSLRWLCRR